MQSFNIVPSRYYWAYCENEDNTGQSGLVLYEQPASGFATYAEALAADLDPAADTGPALFCLSSGMWRDPETPFDPFMSLDGNLPDACIVLGSDILHAADENQVRF